MLKLKLQYFGHLIEKEDSLEKFLMLGKIEGGRRRCQRMRGLDGITDSIYMNLGKQWDIWCETGRPGMLQSMESQKVGHNWETEQQHKADPFLLQTVLTSTDQARS